MSLHCPEDGAERLAFGGIWDVDIRCLGDREANPSWVSCCKFKSSWWQLWIVLGWGFISKKLLLNSPAPALGTCLGLVFIPDDFSTGKQASCFTSPMAEDS